MISRSTLFVVNPHKIIVHSRHITANKATSQLSDAALFNKFLYLIPVQILHQHSDNQYFKLYFTIFAQSTLVSNNRIKIRNKLLHFQLYGSIILKYNSSCVILSQSALKSASSPFSILTNLSMFSLFLPAIARIPTRLVEIVKSASSESASL